MCTGMEGLALAQGVGTIVQGYGAMQAGNAQRGLANAQAIAEQDAAAAEADLIRGRTRRAQGSARAALAASGVSLDSATALDIGQDIGQRGEQDALMALLSGDRRARELRAQGSIAAAQGRARMGSSVIAAGSQVGQGWYAPAQTKPYAGGMTGFYGGYGRSGD